MKLSQLAPLFKNNLSTLPKISYIHLAYFATVATGFASLCAQVAWQKYLTILVGSDTRSISLVVAIFLTGLALGYYVFGKITEKQWNRFHLLKIYGYVELATAVYISVFYIYFEFLKQLSFNSPAYLLLDILISLLALFLPTFLMGASLPVLTAVLPKESKEINACHFKIYGWNTLGAFLGVLFSGFYLLPSFGLAVTLIIAGGINLIAALIFMETIWRERFTDRRIFLWCPPVSPTGFISSSVFLPELLSFLLRFCLSVFSISASGPGFITSLLFCPCLWAGWPGEAFPSDPKKYPLPFS